MTIELSGLPTNSPNLLREGEKQPLVSELNSQEIDRRRAILQDELKIAEQSCLDAESTLFPFSNPTEKNFLDNPEKVRERLSQYLKALLAKEQVRLKLLQIEGKHSEVINPDTQLKITTLERAISEIEGSRSDTSKSPWEQSESQKKPSNLETVVTAICDHLKAVDLADFKYYQKKNRLRLVDLGLDIKEAVFYRGRSFKDRINGGLLGLRGYGTREIYRRTSLSAKRNTRDDNLLFVEEFKNKFNKYQSSWYRQTQGGIEDQV